MKKYFYVFCFTILGLLVGVLLSALSQLIDTRNFLVILLIIFGLWGLKDGFYWWHQIYELKRWRKWTKQ